LKISNCQWFAVISSDCQLAGGSQKAYTAIGSTVLGPGDCRLGNRGFVSENCKKKKKNNNNNNNNNNKQRQSRLPHAMRRLHPLPQPLPHPLPPTRPPATHLRTRPSAAGTAAQPRRHPPTCSGRSPGSTPVSGSHRTENAASQSRACGWRVVGGVVRCALTRRVEWRSNGHGRWSIGRVTGGLDEIRKTERSGK
jgi:hypothetical protein